MHSSPGTILIVDDEPATCSLLQQIFTGHGHVVRCAVDGFSALSEIQQQTPDVLLSDLNMPGMSGFELLAVVRRRFPGILVIATSGAFSGTTVPHGIAADAFYEKASGLRSLLDLVEVSTQPAVAQRLASRKPVPIWLTPRNQQGTAVTEVLISCPNCLRSFALNVGTADFVIHEVDCVFCQTGIQYATVQPMNPSTPHIFHTQPQPHLDCFGNRSIQIRPEDRELLTSTKGA